MLTRDTPTNDSDGWRVNNSQDAPRPSAGLSITINWYLFYYCDLALGVVIVNSIYNKETFSKTPLTCSSGYGRGIIIRGVGVYPLAKHPVDSPSLNIRLK